MSDITKMRIADVEALLHGFEDAYLEATGERLSSDEFYVRYLADDVVDGPFTMAWATYCESLRNAGATVPERHRDERVPELLQSA